MSLPVMQSLPAIPKPMVSAATSLPEDSIKAIDADLANETARRETVCAAARTIDSHAQHALHALQTGDLTGAKLKIDAAEPFVAQILSMVESDAKHGWYLRGHGAVAGAFERLIAAQCFAAFFTSGRLMSKADAFRFNNSEYLSGTIAFAQELGRYAVGRATVSDATSVVVCRDVVEALLGELIKFDFRNGPLRRKYDGVKYVVERLSNLLYELSLTGAYVAPPPEDAQPVKRQKLDGDTAAQAEQATGPAVLDSAEFEAMRTTMDAYDKRREDVIKRTRDLQKLSKNSIFALQRGDPTKAAGMLDKVAELALAILKEHIEEEPALRQGSFTNAMEEFAEGVLFKVWLENRTVCPIDADEFKGLVDCSEYLGGLVDFTGEVGRYGVAAATRRDEVGVNDVLAADLTVQDTLMRLGLPSKLAKKEGMLRTNVKKMEQKLYELSMVKALGRKVTVADTEEPSAGAADAKL